MAIENVQQLLMEQLGKNNNTEIFTTAAQQVRIGIVLISC